MPAFDPDRLKLTDFMDLPTLQEIQDSFAAVANVKATITDADGKLLTQPTPTTDFLKRQSAIAAAQENGPQREGGEYVAPIMVNNQRLGTIRMSARGARRRRMTAARPRWRKSWASNSSSSSTPSPN